MTNKLLPHWITVADRRRFKAMKISWVASRLGLDVANESHAPCFRPWMHKHEDRYPSLAFDRRRNRFKCFACDLSGDNFDLVRALLSTRNGGARTTFLQAAAVLAELLKVHGSAVPFTDCGAVPNYPRLPQWQVYQSLIELCGPTLTDMARGYLEERGITETHALRLGVRAYDDYSIFDQLKARHGPEAVSLAGLRGENGHFSFYKHRLLFFFFNPRITPLPVYVIARSIGDSPRVHNRYTRPQGLAAPCFYNAIDLDGGLTVNMTSSELAPLVLAEGMMDTISAVAMGYRSIGYPSSFRHDWLSQIRDREIWITAQGDRKGQLTSRTLSGLLVQQGKTPHVISLTPGQDLNDQLQNGAVPCHNDVHQDVVGAI